MSHRGLIQRWGSRSDSRLSYEFFESAKRLAATHVGEPGDDVILLPIMLLYRFAIELSLKESIHYAALLRRRNKDSDPSLETHAVSERLERKHRHSIGALVHELNTHMTALDLQVIPKDTGRILQMLAEADATGEAFRYTGKLAETYDNIDFPSLNAALDETYGITAASHDVLEAYGSAQDEYLEVEREIDAEMRAEYESNYKSEMGGW
ncbi:hypothetical protein GY21_08505 [Cryobacterium roopkundense]|uniref:Uncharacterized protein n=1 Tax=Cryobacterium roopkundense TaxID=1001240 RepID=A0A099JEP5_9MICO|nr:hypothetical protein GY21_08505 [Cryobacterium roopkundense]